MAKGKSTIPSISYDLVEPKKQKILRKWRIAKLNSDRAGVKLKEMRDALATQIGIGKIIMPDGNVIQITHSVREDIAWAQAFRTLVKEFFPIIADNPEIAEKFTYIKQRAELQHKASPSSRWEVREIQKEKSNAQVEGKN